MHPQVVAAMPAQYCVSIASLDAQHAVHPIANAKGFAFAAVEGKFFDQGVANSMTAPEVLVRHMTPQTPST